MINLFLFTQQVKSAGTLSWHYVQYPTWNQWRSDFDIRYVSGGHSYSTSYDNYGWWPAFKVDNGNLVYILGRNKGEASSNNVYVKTNLSYPLDNNYILVQWIVTNHDTEPHYVSLASHTDVQIIDNDRARVDWYGGNRGLTMTQDKKFFELYNTKLTLLVRDGYGVTNVDDFWFGEWWPSHQHYWDNRTDRKSLVGRDSAFSIGWHKRAIYPHQTLTFGVLLGVGDNLKSPPIINVTTNFQQNYNPNSKVNVTVIVQDYDAGETITLYCNFPNGITKYHNKSLTSWKAGSHGLNESYSFEVTLGTTVSSYPLTVWANDGLYKSNVFTKQLLVNQAPKLTITNTIASTYYTGGTVDVQGKLWDDTYAVISYQFDNDFAFSVNSQIDCYNVEVPFRKTFPLRQKVLSYGSHVLHIWATDEFRVKSTQYDFPFTYVQLHAPEIMLTTDFNDSVHYNNKIFVSGQFRDLDVGDTLTLSVKYPTDDPTAPFNPFYTVTSQGEWVKFDFEYTIPHLDAGNHSLIFVVVDQRGSNSRDAIFTFTNVKYPNPSPVPSPSPIPTPIDTKPPSGHYIDSNETTTYVPTYTSDSNGDPTITYVPSNTSFYFITQSKPPPKRTPDLTPTPTPSASEAQWANAGSGVASNSNSKQNKKKLIPIIAGAAAAVGVAAIVAAAVLIHEAKIKAKEFDPEDPDLFNGPDGDAAQENDNPLYNEDAQDDPFADEFDEEAPNDGNNMLPQ
ncbi:Listeria-Bacteroides repeat domain (List Bact rpt) family [Trichomonas vaginalis G3]|uniref:Listeria-Bacteroides repeat domain (List Bact rpt) family n=1 Tax=Trichomonas vaginalis (strain ATCC PRA-98 / G3) TaxID=412133 RepID=UPI0021E556B2|nr:Listeria-Bacteroides repeat domain (List Bact rpt) family [Trichomonas vaginalis G3]KAI5482960.1 Listeria-Bacteroides repeat domain (List Bact rpt) family [Trichomonas vaginalis G3]